ncbi:hypothetical protein FB45DRAFT_1004140 [Roridomyces roridus]|uniref:Uncharacterized protein n=1 Tax=Roridomyces roridus TaxID=1738132 RepID=A0AAD7BRR0_9AGAR|nr:hypothetical protein FB45DRAFT_1004140 [Roridomyces roridus]
MLSSLINYRPNRKKISVIKSPFPVKKPDPASPHPYASQVFEIGDNSFEEQDQDGRSSVSEQVPAQAPPPAGPAPPVHSPRVDVDIESTPSDWFPSHFLKTDSIAGPSGLSAAAKLIVTSATADAEDEDEGDDHTSETSEDVLSNLEALGAADFVNLPSEDSLGVPSTRKAAPSPIKIPNAALHGPKVQIVRSATSVSRPDSVVDLDGASAVSGTTLARALIGDSFVLSADRSSRYRSGGSVLTRSDSATLPRGEHPYVLSGVFSPGLDSSGLPVPPVPQMPEELRRVIAESRLKATRGDDTPGSDDDNSRRISRISEAPTPASSAPYTPEPPSVSDNTTPASDPSPDPSSNYHHGVSLSSFPTSPGQSSTTPSEARSSRDFDNVLDYYNFEPSPGPNTSAFDPPTPDVTADPSRYRPVFSPITEESGSQLSPNSFRSRRTANGKVSLSSSPAPSTGSGRTDWRPGEIRSLPPHPGLLPIGSGDRPRSIPPSPSPIVLPQPPLLSTHSTPALIPSAPSSDSDDHLLPPSRSIFNRQRSGSAPSPIMVVRDSRDFNTYNLSVSPLVRSSSTSSTPIEEIDEQIIVRGEQTFPETPSAFSPMFSPADRNSMMPPPPTGTKPGFTSLAQQVLLTRAATTVRGARHSRQASLTSTRERNRSTAIFATAHSHMADALKEAFKDSEGKGEPEAHEISEEAPPEADMADNEKPELPGSPEAPESASLYSLPSAKTKSSHRFSQSSDSHSHSHGRLEAVSEDYHSKPLPAMPDSPEDPEPVISAPPVIPPPPEPVVEVGPSSSSSSLARPSPAPSLTTKPASGPSSPRSTPSPAPPEFTEEPAQIPPPPPLPSQSPVVASPPPSRPPLALSPPPIPVDASLGSPHIVPVVTPARGPDSPHHSSFGSPPPYYTVMYDTGRDPERMTPSTGGSGGYADHFSPSSSSIQLREQRALSVQSTVASPNPSRRARSRPPLPIGPRRPSASAAIAPTHGRNRNGSVSSIASTVPGGRRHGSSPRFQTPSVKWRGYTMDAAKWTFSSAQLQGIVSRAIRQSAEASSIRLLRLETVDQDIPDELYRLDMQRMDIKTRYKMLTRRRAALFSSLTGQLEGTEAEDQTLRLVENLKEISAELDRLAEELHSADEQIAQLNSLRDVHSASALAMALRKLNASFLKQIAETAELRGQMESMQAERDEAWTQAVDVANDYDYLSERMEGASPGPSSYSKRSSRVLAVKKSSIRVSKAGLRSSSRRSSVSSIGGHRVSSSGLPSATLEDIPPVPPIPRRRPDDIMTDISARASALSSTPSSERGTLDRVQDELYTMLGIPLPEKPSRKSHSVIMSASSDIENPLLSSLASRPRRRSDASRPSSLPGNHALSEALYAMTADRDAMLATLEMLDD